MDRIDAVKILTFLTIVHVTNCQTIGSVSGPPRVASGTSVPLTCTLNGGASDQIQWTDTTGGVSVTIYTDARRFSRDSKYLNFNITSLSTTESVMTILNAEVEDDGTYQCSIPSDATGQDTSLVIEDPGMLIDTLESIVMNDMDMYQATCDVVGSKPQVTITWTLNGISQTDGNGNTIVETNPTSTPPLSNTKSVFTFRATSDNRGQTLVCETTGHQITELNGQASRNLDIHSSPDEAGTNVTAGYVTHGTGIIVSCEAVNQPTPTMRNYYIYSDGMPIHDSTDGDNQITVQDPVVGTNYTCRAGNYLGNTSLSEAVPYDPTRPTTPSTTTESSTAEGTTTERPADMMTSPEPNDGNETGPPSGGDGPSAAAIGGGVAGAIVFIIIIVIVIIYFKKRGKDGPSAASSTKKHGSSAVGTSNGSEKDKIKPVAAPRDQGSIQHTTDNPGQAEYAMVDRKKPGGDMPDARGPGQKEPQGMLYADLDLSASAGHTEKKVPQNKDDVVVYSSILV